MLRIAYPLILSHMSFTLQTFIDRIFLTWYSPEAVAGAVAGLFMTWGVAGLFIATGEYLTTFVAQYRGARRPERIGPAMWQGIYFSLLAGAIMAALAPSAQWFFDWAGHDPRVREYEVSFSATLLRGGLPVVLMATLASFFSGRGQTLVVLRVNLLVTLVNVGLDYLWIFGRLGFPRAGVFGAAAATITSQAVGSLAYFGLLLAPEFRRRYATLSGWRFDRELFGRLIRYGLPSGLHWSIEIFAFGLFLMIVGRIGTTELVATGLAFNLNGLVFVPMLGLGLGLSSIVGRHLGANQPDLAERSTWSALGIALVYMTACGAAYFLLPSWLLAPYRFGADAGSFAPVAALTTILLRFVAVYSIFDMLNVICAAALRGAGDTSFAMWCATFFSIFAMLLPAYVACIVLGAGVLAAWTAASAYVFCVGTLLLLRFRAGRWKAMRVIENALG